MPAPYVVTRGNLHHVREQISVFLDELSGRIDNIVTFLQLEDNLLVFDINAGVDYDLPIVADDPVPLTVEVTTGLNPPTISGSTITINSPGVYRLSGQFGMDTGSAGNIVTVEPRFNGVKGGLTAGVRQASGQGSIAVQSSAVITAAADIGDTFDFVATSTDINAEIVASISGGNCVQVEFDWDAIQALNP
jgi:hypothetical protein